MPFSVNFRSISAQRLRTVPPPLAGFATMSQVFGSVVLIVFFSNVLKISRYSGQKYVLVRQIAFLIENLAAARGLISNIVVNT